MGRRYSLGLYEKGLPYSLSWEEKMLCAKKSGFDFIEISIDETDEKLSRLNMTANDINELNQLMRETGVPIRTMCLSGHRRYPLGSRDPKKVEKSLEIMDKAIKLAEKLGIRIIQLAGYDVYYEQSDQETKNRFLENLKISVEMASKEGVQLGFETMETEFMNTVEKSMEFVSLINSPYLGIYPDIGNLTNAAVNSGKNLIYDLESGRGHILAMHLKETVPGKFREIPFGSGHVNFREGIGKAWNLGVRKFVTEFWYTGALDWRVEIESNCKMFRRIIDEVEEGNYYVGKTKKGSL